jgi:hypothetical protein
MYFSFIYFSHKMYNTSFSFQCLQALNKVSKQVVFIFNWQIKIIYMFIYFWCIVDPIIHMESLVRSPVDDWKCE